MRDKTSRRVRLAYGSALTIDSRQSETLTDHLTLFPAGTASVNAFKMYPADTRNREDSQIIVSQGAEKQEVRARRPMGDPWLSSATDVEMREAIMANMARNLSRQPEKQLGVEFIDRSIDLDYGAVGGHQASWFRESARPTPGRSPGRRPHRSRGETRAVSEDRKLPPGSEQVRREKRSMRPAAERPKTPRPESARDHADIVAEFADALRQEGFQLRGAPVMDGTWQREKVEGDRGHTKSGRYKAYTDGLPAGFIQNFKRGEGIRWQAERPMPAMTDAERQHLAASRAARAREQAEALEIATAKAQDRWAAGMGVKQHPYLTAKGISADAEAMRRDRHGNLMTAMVDGTGLLRNVQTITPDGTKRFVPGAQVFGLFSLVGKIQHDQPIMIAEGVATAKTMHEATGMPVVVAYNAGNLGPVSKVIAEIAPNSRQIFAADNDWHLPTKDNPQPNVGKEKAEAASKEVGGIVLLPGFGDIEMKGTPTDWNDFAALYGKARLVAAIRQALMEQGIDMEDIKKPKVTQEMRDLARQTTVIQQNDAQINQAREAHRQAEEHSHDNSRGIER